MDTENAHLLSDVEKDTLKKLIKEVWPSIDVPENSECLHQKCPECQGAGFKKDGNPCIHMISCPCPKCNPKYNINRTLK